MNVEIRPAVDSDRGGCHHALAVVVDEGRWLSRLAAPSLEGYSAWWQSMRDMQAPQTVATDGDAVVGWCDMSPRDNPLNAHIGTLGMGLVPAYRSLGLGKAMLTLALEQARERKLERIQLSVLHDNDAAIGLYTRLGFVVEGRRHREWKHEGVYRDSVLMALDVT